MSTSTEITRIQTARNTIRDKLIDLGLALSADTLDKLATAIAGIVNNGAVSAEVKEGDSYTIPAGYHNGDGKAHTGCVPERERRYRDGGGRSRQQDHR